MENKNFNRYRTILVRPMNSTIAREIYKLDDTIPCDIDGYEFININTCTSYWDVKGKPFPMEDDTLNKTEDNSELIHPERYKKGGMECWDVMEIVKGWFKTLVFCELNVFKYNWRQGSKDILTKEIEKQKIYSEKQIDIIKRNFHWVNKKTGEKYAVIKVVKVNDIDTNVVICMNINGNIESFTKNYFTKEFKPVYSKN